MKLKKSVLTAMEHDTLKAVLSYSRGIGDVAAF